MEKVLYRKEFLTSSRSWRVRLCDLDVDIEDDELIIALSKAHTTASKELGIDDTKIQLIECDVDDLL